MFDISSRCKIKDVILQHTCVNIRSTYWYCTCPAVIWLKYCRYGVKINVFVRVGLIYFIYGVVSCRHEMPK